MSAALSALGLRFLQAGGNEGLSRDLLAASFMMLSCLAFCYTLKTEATPSSETPFGFQSIARLCIPEGELFGSCSAGPNRKMKVSNFKVIFHSFLGRTEKNHVNSFTMTVAHPRFERGTS
jgi:hypothetical protein